MKLILLLTWLAIATTGAAENLPVDARNYSPASWSPYAAGAGIGLLLCLTMLFSKKPVGASSAYASVAGLAGKNNRARAHGEPKVL